MSTPTPKRAVTVDPETNEIQTFEVKPFLAFLQEHRDGEMHDELSETLHRLVQAVQMIRKGGSLALKITVKPAGKSRDMVAVTDEVTVKLPEPEREEKLMFVDNDYNLSRDNPRQIPLPNLREVPATSAPTSLKEAN